MLARLLMLLVVLLTACADTGEVPQVRDGVVSLAGWEPEQPASLHGQWLLQRGLVPPPVPLVDPVPVEVPGRWDADPDSPMDGSLGEATYQVVFTDLPEASLLLEVEVAGAVEGYVDGVLVDGAGSVPFETRTSTWIPITLLLPRGAERAEVRLLVANDAVRLGGVTTAVIGEESAQQQRIARRTVLDMLNVSVLTTFFLVFLTIGLRRQNEPAYVLFALLCLALALRDLLGGSGDLRDVLLPWVPWSVAIKIEYLTLPLGAIFGWGTVTHISRLMRRHPVTWGLVGVCVALGIATLVVPTRLLGWVLPASQIVLLSATVGVFFLLGTAGLRGDKRALPFLVAMSVLLLAVCHDVLISMGFFETGVRLGTIGFLAVIAVFALLLVGDFVASFLLNEKLNAELQRSHGELQRTHRAVLRFVPDAFIGLLGKRSIVEVERGDHIEARMEILFCDLRNFTTLIESLGPDRAFPFVNRYLRHMEPAITGNGGFISQYLGDCIMALFPGEDADAAVRAAIQMSVALADFNEREPEGPVRFGIGIASGPIMLGTIGGRERLDGGVIGDSVNHASRVEGMTKLYGTVLIIDDSTRRRLTGREQVTLRELDRVIAKGRRTPSAIWEVVDALPPRERQARMETREDWEAGLAAYRRGDLKTARAHFEAVAAASPRDEAARLFVHRCEVLSREGLPPGWDGTTSLTRK